MKKMIYGFLFGMVLVGVGCGDKPNVEGTKNDPSIQAVKALFTTAKANGNSLNINENVLPLTMDEWDQTFPYLFSLITQEQSFPCSSGTRSTSYVYANEDEEDMNPIISRTITFTNCEFVVADFITLLPKSSPECITKITLNGTFTVGEQVASEPTTLSATINIGVEKSEPIQCILDLAIDNQAPYETTGTICGVDISTVADACSL